jgi:MoxR-like ATPase
VTPAGVAQRILDEVERAVIGKRDVLELVLAALLADGHVLLEDVPGTAKTLIARSFARVTGLRLRRVQFTPDLLPLDITGSAVFDQRSGDLDFRPGPVFTDLLLADEVNRAPAKTQAALLEAMEERQVTTDGTTRPLGRPFLVLATQNPIDHEGTYALPEAQLDRFLARVRVGYPSRQDELRLVRERADRGTDEVALEVVADRAQLLALQAQVECVHVDADVAGFIVDLTTATRSSPKVSLGASPRGTLALFSLARARAVIAGRGFVTPDDVKAVAVPALAHRLIPRPELWVQDVTGEDVVRQCLEQVPTPATWPGESTTDDGPPAESPAPPRRRRGPA